MDPHKQFCHNPNCPARGKVGEGNIMIHSAKERRYRCTTCGKTFAATKGTPFYWLHTSVDLVTLVITLLVHGCPPKAIVAAFKLDERTVANWQRRAGLHTENVHKYVVQNQSLELGQVQADELKAKLAGRSFWMAMAMAVSSRLWLGGAISDSRDQGLIDTLLRQIRACARSLDLILFCIDGLSSYIKGIFKVFRIAIRNGCRGRPRMVMPEELMVCQVIKKRVKGRVVEVMER